MDKPILNKQAFWDVDMETIDYKKNALDIIEKVVTLGTFEDFRSIAKFYGEERIRREIVNTKYLGDKEVNFCCLIFKLDFCDFEYYKKGVLRSNSEVKSEFSNYDHYN